MLKNVYKKGKCIKLKERFKTYSFWFAVLSALFLIIQATLKPFGITISEDKVMVFINGILGAFVVAGIIQSPETIINEEPKDKEKENQNQNDMDKKEGK